MTAKKKSVDFRQFSYAKMDKMPGPGSDDAAPMDEGEREAGPTAPEQGGESDIPTRAEFLHWFGELREDFKSHKAEMAEIMGEIREDLTNLAHRADDMDDRLDSHTDAVNKLQSQYIALDRENETLREKVADIENRTRRSNLRFKGIAEAEAFTDCVSTVQRFCRFLLCSDGSPPDNVPEIKIDRAHRALGQRIANRPKDIVVCFSDYQMKERVFSIARAKPTWSWEDQVVGVYADLSAATLKNRFELREAAAFLRAEQFKFRWLFPFGMVATVEGTSSRIKTAEDALHLLGPRGFKPSSNNNKSAAATPSSVAQLPKWQRVGAGKNRLRRQSPGTTSTVTPGT